MSAEFSVSLQAIRVEIFAASCAIGIYNAALPPFVRLLRDIADNGQAVVVVTHDPALAARADRRIHIVDGKIREMIQGHYRTPEVSVPVGVTASEP